MSIAAQPPLPRFGLGGSLAEARLARGLELRDAERETRIRARYLAALEDEEFDLLPGDAWGLVFLRTYASYLGLEPAGYAEEYCRRRDVRAARLGTVITRVPRRRLGLLRRRY
jgi:cytoskeletal protein RodZ